MFSFWLYELKIGLFYAKHFNWLKIRGSQYLIAELISLTIIYMDISF